MDGQSQLGCINQNLVGRRSYQIYIYIYIGRLDLTPSSGFFISRDLVHLRMNQSSEVMGETSM